MCRLLAFASSDNTTIESLLTPEEFENYRKLSELHGDGWGAAWQTNGSSVQQANSVERAIDDDNFLYISKKSANIGIVHLRWATTGFPVCVENTHPFAAGSWRFAHNGAIANSDRLLNELSPARRVALNGTTDSEMYFQLLLENIEKTGDVVTAIQATVKTIRKVCGLGSLNCLLLSDGRMIAVQAYGETPSPTDSLAEQLGGIDKLPIGHGDEYYHLRFTVRDGSILVASTGVGGEGWENLGEDSIIDVNFARGDVKIHNLSDGDVVRTIPLSPTIAVE